MARDTGPMNVEQVRERTEELRRIAAQTTNAEDRKKLLKMADEFEACAHRVFGEKD